MTDTEFRCIDPDTPHHDDHVRDDVLNAGCRRCARFFDLMERPGDAWRKAWDAHRESYEVAR